MAVVVGTGPATQVARRGAVVLDVGHAEERLAERRRQRREDIIFALEAARARRRRRPRA